MKTPVYSTDKPNENKETKTDFVYLGNLKMRFHKGKQRLVGNMLLDPFINIDPSFISVSSKTGKRVIRVVVDENKTGPDMFGFTHNMKVDPFVLAKDMDDDSDANSDDDINFRHGNLKDSRLGISEESINETSDKKILMEWEMALKKEIAEIKINLTNTRNKFSPEFKKLIKIKTIQNTLLQQILQKKRIVDMEFRKTQTASFVEIARKTLSPEIFLEIMNKSFLENNK